MVATSLTRAFCGWDAAWAKAEATSSGIASNTLHRMQFSVRLPTALFLESNMAPVSQLAAAFPAVP
jgi:hypothetical protein